MLIFPPYRTAGFYDKMVCVPMGIAYLGAVLRKDYEVRLLDAVVEGYKQDRWLGNGYFEYGLTPDQIIAEIEDFAPQVVGVSCIFSSQFLFAADLIGRVKKEFPDIITVIGGAHPSFLPEDSFQHMPGLDFIIIGEGEESFPALLKAIEKGSGFETIDGLAFRDNGTIRVNPKTRFIENLDNLPFPARDLLPMEKYFKINIPALVFSKSPRNTSFITSRGCPFHCRFCSSCHYWGRRIRFRSTENVLAEIEELISRYRVEELKFEDDNLMAKVAKAKEIFRGMIGRGYKLHWNMPTGVWISALDDDELLNLMKQSGCYEVILAFESGDQYVIDNIIKKPLDLKKAMEITGKVKDHGIDTHAFFVLGLPGETRANIEQTFRYARSLALDKAFFFLFNPLPGAELYQEAIDKGMFDKEEVYRINYGLCGITTDEFNPALIQKMIARNHWYIAVRPLWRDPKKFVFKYLRRRTSIGTLKTAFRLAKFSYQASKNSPSQLRK